MDNQKIADEIIKFAEEQTNSLSDRDFLEVYREVVSQLDSSIQAKEEERRDD